MILELLTRSTEVIPAIYDAWIPLVIAGISAAASLYATKKKADASKKLRSEQTDVLNRQKSLADYYNSEAQRDFFQTELGRGAIDRIRQQYKEATKKNADKISKSGATQESKVATQAANLDKYNQAVGRIAGYGANYKNNMNKSYEGILTGLYKGNDGVYGRDVQSWGNLQNNSFNALSQGLGELDFDKNQEG